MQFNWKRFCRDHGIEFVESGPNTKAGEISIACPFCGDDPSHHMGLNNKGYYACWRNHSHRGKSPEPLIQKLIGCSREQARRIIGKPSFDTSDFKNKVQSLLDKEPEEQVERPSHLEMPENFRPFVGNLNSISKLFYEFLMMRGFDSYDDVARLSEEYDLRYCLSGYWKYRVIFPLYIDDKLITWTSRTVGGSELRYLSLPASKPMDGQVALDDVPNCTYPYDNVNQERHKPNVLFIVEGPMDALKVDFYGKQFGGRALCVFGSNPTEHTISKVTNVVDNIQPKHVIALMDDMNLSMRVASLFSHVDARPMVLDRGDPGDLRSDEVQSFIEQFR